MSSQVKPVPEGFHTATPYLIIRGADAAIDFYKKAFGATELMRHVDAEGKVRHAQILIGDSPLMVADEFPSIPHCLGPLSRGGSTVHIYLYVEDVDALFERAIAAGASQIMPLADQWYGDRLGGMTDPFGHVWWLASHREDLTPEELARRSDAAGRG